MSRYKGLVAVATVALGIGSVDFAWADETAIVHGVIKTPTVKVLGIPIAPEVALRLTGDPGQVYFSWDGPANQVLNQTFNSVLLPGEHVFRASLPQGTFSPYAAAGTWTLAQIEVCGYSLCNTYEGASLAAVIPSLTVQVSNPKSDSEPPLVSAAAILTPSVARQDLAKVELRLYLQDNLSGVYSVTVTFGTGARDHTLTISGQTGSPIVAPTTFELIGHCGCSRLAAGTYPVIYVGLTDAASNTVMITDPAAISSLFSGQATLTLTN